MTTNTKLDEIEAKVLDDYRQVAGKVLWVHDLTAYIGDTDFQNYFYFRQPIRVRIRHNQNEEALLRDTGGYMDPYWDVDIVDTNHPELPPEGLRSAWIYGTSYDLKTGEQDKARFRFETFGQKIARTLSAFVGV